MKNSQGTTDTLTFVAPTGGVVAGTPVLIGTYLVFPVTSAAATESFEGLVRGRFAGVAKASADVVGIGDPLYWDDTAKELALVPDDTYFVGKAASAAGNGVTTVDLDLMNTAKVVTAAPP